MENLLDPRNITDAIGARIKDRVGWNGGLIRTGIVIDATETDGIVSFICQFDDGSVDTANWGALAVDIDLIDGQKYMLMDGHVVTIHAASTNGRFYFDYSELMSDPYNTFTEGLSANGFAHHYDCYMNALKNIP